MPDADHVRRGRCPASASTTSTSATAASNAAAAEWSTSSSTSARRAPSTRGRRRPRGCGCGRSRRRARRPPDGSSRSSVGGRPRPAARGRRAGCSTTSPRRWRSATSDVIVVRESPVIRARSLRLAVPCCRSASITRSLFRSRSPSSDPVFATRATSRRLRRFVKSPDEIPGVRARELRRGCSVKRARRPSARSRPCEGDPPRGRLRHAALPAHRDTGAKRCSPSAAGRCSTGSPTRSTRSPTSTSCTSSRTRASPPTSPPGRRTGGPARAGRARRRHDLERRPAGRDRRHRLRRAPRRARGRRPVRGRRRQPLRLLARRLRRWWSGSSARRARSPCATAPTTGLRRSTP